MNKQLITYIALAAIITGLLGFYGGRFYERKTSQRDMSQRMQNFEEGNFQPEDRPARGNFPEGGNLRIPVQNNTEQNTDQETGQATESEKQ
ncbi:MAG: hypothetical protein ACOZAO_02475 [Patescibacteria group bacterium]